MIDHNEKQEATASIRKVFAVFGMFFLLLYGILFSYNAGDISIKATNKRIAETEKKIPQVSKHKTNDTIDLVEIVKLIPAEKLANISEMSDEQKDELFQYGKIFEDGCVSWELHKRDKYLLITERDGRSVIKPYPMKDGKFLVVVYHERGNHGQTTDLTMLIYSPTDNQLNAVEVIGSYLKEVKENEFLAEQDWFSPNKEYPVSYYLGDNGVIHAHPWTWAESRWEEKMIKYDVYFRWNGQQFQMIKQPKSP